MQVTFLWRQERGATCDRVYLRVNRVTDKGREALGLMHHIPGTDVWVLTLDLAPTTRLSYGFVPCPRARSRPPAHRPSCPVTCDRTRIRSTGPGHSSSTARESAIPSTVARSPARSPNGTMSPQPARDGSTAPSCGCPARRTRPAAGTRCSPRRCARSRCASSSPRRRQRRFRTTRAHRPRSP
ncbi:hypothetical protein CXF35_03660 [Corynebacterium bovis]|uniref:Enterochelin esterase N-terminal domain-containing protein n=1 Tax=Corynebacterium bovis TaxID=36808 RepID=A0A426Q7L4_9CORY|nr:hypothetical protein CXF40_09205 [Corynebacterium bovis]RRO97892.1 hypothetical protein CXF32_02750 [Corynebacterium bovis]RRO99300.1 hypothetical protein CXF31_02755 [Corynebacterium bovis]RRO99476.1 hypothetical protein CXF41_09525 [Corynebacterium bovis]RRQ04310.1 hypothetical protein CXF39_02270 [Corynebacterium bovis]